MVREGAKDLVTPALALIFHVGERVSLLITFLWLCVAQEIFVTTRSGTWDLKQDNVMVLLAEDGFAFSMVTIISFGQQHLVLW